MIRTDIVYNLYFEIRKPRENYTTTECDHRSDLSAGSGLLLKEPDALPGYFNSQSIKLHILTLCICLMNVCISLWQGCTRLLKSCGSLWYDCTRVCNGNNRLCILHNRLCNGNNRVCNGNNRMYILHTRVCNGNNRLCILHNRLCNGNNRLCILHNRMVQKHNSNLQLVKKAYFFYRSLSYKSIQEESIYLYDSTLKYLTKLLSKYFIMDNIRMIHEKRDFSLKNIVEEDIFCKMFLLIMIFTGESISISLFILFFNLKIFT